MKTISAVVLPSGPRVSPEPTLLECDYTQIQEIVGGHFDAVRVEVENEDGDSLIIVGYVHDEGLILDLEPNYLATALFQQELRGPCLLVSGISPDGEYDGESYDVPEWVYEGLTTDLVSRTAKAYNHAQLIGFGMQYAVEEMLCTQEELDDLEDAVEKDDFQNRKPMTAEQKELLTIIGMWAKVEMHRIGVMHKLSKDNPEFKSILRKQINEMLEQIDNKEGE